MGQRNNWDSKTVNSVFWASIIVTMLILVLLIPTDMFPRCLIATHAPIREDCSLVDSLRDTLKVIGVNMLLASIFGGVVWIVKRFRSPPDDS